MSHKDKALCIDALYVEIFIPIQGCKGKGISIYSLPTMLYTLTKLYITRSSK